MIGRLGPVAIVLDRVDPGYDVEAPEPSIPLGRSRRPSEALASALLGFVGRALARKDGLPNRIRRALAGEGFNGQEDECILREALSLRLLLKQHIRTLKRFGQVQAPATVLFYEEEALVGFLPLRP